MNAGKQKPDFALMLDELETLLEKQISLARQGSFGDLEDITALTNQLVEKVVAMQMLQSDEFKSRRLHLQKLYQELHRTVAAREADVARDLNHVRKGRKTIRVYHNSI
jgi:hypothetical protein